MTVVDPNTEGEEVTRQDAIIRLLSYYAKAARLAGFWRLADLLNARVGSLQAEVPLSQLESIPLDYQNIYKIGREYDITYRDLKIETFFPQDRETGFKEEVGRRLAFFSLDRLLVEILESQDFEKLLRYEPEIAVGEVVETEMGSFSVNNEGTVLGIVSPEIFQRR